MRQKHPYEYPESTVAPALPATTLEFCCYGIMFQGCSNLNYIEISATDISATECIYGWMDGVASTGTIVMDSQATWDPYSNGLPSGWSISYL